MIVVKAKKNNAMATNGAPKPGNDESTAYCVYAAPASILFAKVICSSPANPPLLNSPIWINGSAPSAAFSSCTLYIPVNKIINAVAEQINNVSI
ncbi:hypothetical protein D9M71_687220 [compost metagenome]